MYFDNLTLAGLAVAGLYLLLPLLFGRELLRVEEAETAGDTPARPTRIVAATPCGGRGAEPCRGES